MPIKTDFSFKHTVLVKFLVSFREAAFTARFTDSNFFFLTNDKMFPIKLRSKINI